MSDEEREREGAAGGDDPSNGTSAFELAPQAQAEGIENGIFNLVITLCRFYERAEPPELARRRVALYLERLAAGLHLAADDPQRKEPTSP